jgi:hypothetical protein
LRDALQTDDGRQILADALRGLVPPSPVPSLPLDARVADYPEVGRARESAGDQPPPIFITARFRSGSTLLWNIFRHVDGCRSYYEPLNERRWFDPARRGSRVDSTHIGASEYWLEYDGLEHLGGVFHDDWNRRNLHMDENAWDPDLAAYVRGLIGAAPPKRAVLQFNRVDFRLPWLKRWFPHAILVHLYRHPRDQWCSSLVDIKAFPRDGHLRDFGPHDHFYLLHWARDLRHRFPILDERAVEHPYELFYIIWKLSWLFGRHYAHYSIGLERLIAQPELELRSLFAAVGMPDVPPSSLLHLVDRQSQGKWRAYADDDWFSAHESRCETLLRVWGGIAAAPQSDSIDPARL